MKKIYLIITISIISLLFAASCSILPGTGSNQLTGTTWKLISYDGNIPLAGKNMTASFDAQEIQGSASCNTYFGTYRLKGDQISIGELGWTEMACMDPEGIMEQEQVIMKLLSIQLIFYPGRKAADYNIRWRAIDISTIDWNRLGNFPSAPGRWDSQ